MILSLNSLVATFLAMCACLCVACCCHSHSKHQHPLYLLIMAPFPDDRPGFDTRYAGSGGPGIQPAVQLAVDHVNSRSHLLCDYKLEYILGDSGCAVKSIAIESLLRHAIMSSKQVVGVVGPVCSTSATAVAPLLARDEVSLLHLTSAISIKLADKNYINTIKLLGTSTRFVEAFFHIMQENQWKTVGTLFENERVEFTSLHDVFQKGVISRGGTVLSSPVTQSHISLEQFKAAPTRIIFLFVAADLASRILCLAHPKYFDITYPTYQWVIAARQRRPLEAPTFQLSGKQYSCSREEIQQALVGSIVVVAITEGNRNTVLQSGMAFEEYNRALEEKLDAANVTKDPNGNVYYDAVWAFALAFGNSQQQLDKSGFVLSQYTLGQRYATNVIRKELLSLDFEGASGRVHFNSTTGEGKPELDIHQVELNDGPGPLIKLVKIGHFSIQDNTLHLTNGSFLDDEFPQQVIKLHPVVGTVVLVLTTALLALTVVSHVFTIMYRNVRVIKANSPNLNHLIFSGCYLFLIATCVLIIQGSFLTHLQSEVASCVLCSTISWCFPMGYSLVFGTVCMKSFRIYKLFTSFKRHSGILLTDNSLILSVVFLLSMDIIINISWNAIAPWRVVKQESFAEHIIFIEAHCESDYLLVWITVLLVPKSILTLIVIYLSILTRRITRKEFKYSKSINILAYSLVLLYSIGLPISILFFSSPYISIITLSVVFLSTVILCLSTLSLHPLAYLCASCNRQTLTFKSILRLY